MLHLRPGVREHFIGWLRPRDPGLADDYERRYRRAYLPDAEQKALSTRVRAIAERAGAAYATPGGGPRAHLTAHTASSRVAGPGARRPRARRGDLRSAHEGRSEQRPADRQRRAPR